MRKIRYSGRGEDAFRHPIQQRCKHRHDGRRTGGNGDDGLPDNWAEGVEGQSPFQRAKDDQRHQHCAAGGIDQHVGQDHLAAQSQVRPIDQIAATR